MANMRKTARREPQYALTSLNYAFWLHRPTRWDGWFLMVSESPSAHVARALLWRRTTPATPRNLPLLLRPRH